MKNFKLMLALCLVGLFGVQILQAQEKEYHYKRNFAEALQKSIYFYDAEMCGTGIDGGELMWRGDCHLSDTAIVLEGVMAELAAKYPENFDPDGNGMVDVSGGFHDAGDHVKFGLPQTYASQTMEWALYEFREAYEQTGTLDHMQAVLRRFSDYYLKSTFWDYDGNVVAFCYMVGEGGTDHNYWGSPELQDTEEFPRPAVFATAGTPASDQTAGASASLAISYLNWKDTDSVYANRCLKAAVALYDFSIAHRGLGSSGGFYSSSFDEDELALAAVWLYVATQKWDYIDDITSTQDGVYTGWMKKIISTTANTWQNIWVHCWDTKWGAMFAKLAPITNDEHHWYLYRWNLEYWSGVPHRDPADIAYLSKTPAGFSFLNSWGSARYNTAAQLCALTYRKYSNEFDKELFADWALTQMEYIMGDNPMKKSYIVGYDSTSVRNPHHRAAHGSSTNSMYEPANPKHVLWGAMVGGPGSDDEHLDTISDYVYNEVAIDYNAAFVGSLAGCWYYYGRDHKPDPNFSTVEEPFEEFIVEAMMNQENHERSQFTIKVINRSEHAPTKEFQFKTRYYFSIQEMVDAGQTIDDLIVEVYYNQYNEAEISEPVLVDAANSVYYFEFTWPEKSFFGAREIQLALIAPQNSEWQSYWDISNDYSREGLNFEEFTQTYKIPLYLDGELYIGEEYKGADNSTPVVKVAATPMSGKMPLTVTFDGSESFDWDQKIENYAWNFGNGSQVVGDSVISYTYTQPGNYMASLTLTDDQGLSASDFVEIAVYDTIGGCSLLTTFGVPRTEPIPSTDGSEAFSFISVVGEGPDMSNITSAEFNWDLAQESLWTLAFYTANGKPDWYIDLTKSLTHTFAASDCKVVFDSTGVAGLDGTYFLNRHEGNLVLVAEGGAYAIYLSKTDVEVEACPALKGVSVNGNPNVSATVDVYPNPFVSGIVVEAKGEEAITGIKVMNAEGAVVYSESGLNIKDSKKVDLDGAAGIYVVEVETAKETIKKQVVKK